MKVINALAELIGAILQMVLLMFILTIMALGLIVAFPFIVIVALLSAKPESKHNDWKA